MRLATQHAKERQPYSAVYRVGPRDVDQALVDFLGKDLAQKLGVTQKES
jgi:hypothetical protein